MVPDTTLFLVFTSANNTLSIAGDTSNPYANGNVFANAPFFPFADFDYTFRTYYDDNPSPAPEPGVLALLALGLVGISLSRKK